MYILYFAISLGTLVAAFMADVGVGGVAFLLLMSFLFLLVGAWSLLSARLESRRRPERQMIGAEELRQLRERAAQAKARQAAEQEPDGGQ